MSPCPPRPPIGAMRLAAITGRHVIVFFHIPQGAILDPFHLLVSLLGLLELGVLAILWLMWRGCR
jgi:hypothetical protein